MRTLWRSAGLWCWIAALAWPLGAQPDDLLMRIWNGVQKAQTEHASGCGKIVETRTSKLLAKPMVFRGKFCADGMDRFALEYTEPDPIRIRFNRDYLNVTTGGGKHTEAIEVGSKVRQTQAYFSREKSIENLKKNFAIQVREDGGLYEMKLVPSSARFRRRLNYVILKLAKENFLLRSLEIDGTSGVNSVFAIDITSLDAKIPPSTFEVYRPR